MVTEFILYNDWLSINGSNYTVLFQRTGDCFESMSRRCIVHFWVSPPNCRVIKYRFIVVNHVVFFHEKDLITDLEPMYKWIIDCKHYEMGKSYYCVIGVETRHIDHPFKNCRAFRKVFTCAGTGLEWNVAAWSTKEVQFSWSAMSIIFFFTCLLGTHIHNVCVHVCVCARTRKALELLVLWPLSNFAKTKGRELVSRNYGPRFRDLSMSHSC